MPTLTDLDALVPAPRTVKVGGKTWKVPGSPPVAWMLALTRLESDDAADEAALLGTVMELVGELFAIHQPGEQAAITKALGTLDAATLLNAVRSIYSDQSPEERPTKRPAAGTTSGNRSRKTRG